METATYEVEAQIEATHWWFVVRRRLLGRMIATFSLPTDSSVLDIGSSTGTNLRLLRQLGFSNVQGLDFSAEAVRWCAEKQLGIVKRGDICALPFENERFDMVLATDIIEHVEDDGLALREIRRVLRLGGYVLITVPAFEEIWGLQDEVAHHKRRYRKEMLVSRIEDAGLIVDRAFYFNALLFVPIWLARRLIDLLSIKLNSEGEVNTPFLNWLFTKIFAFDTWMAPANIFPFGVSILAVVRKRETRPSRIGLVEETDKQ